MCELLALSASAPVDVKLSFAELARHGGDTGIHTDGWGVAFMEGRDARVFRDPSPATTSPWVACLAQHPPKSDTVVAYIRHATRGAVTLANTQPFARELWGRAHIFVHNGFFAGLETNDNTASRFQPIGETDSEIACCRLFDRFAARVAPDSKTRDQDVRGIFAEFAREMQRFGPANIIYASHGRILAHADRRTQRAGVIAPPGLWVLERACVVGPESELAAAGVEVSANASLSVALLASVPLTTEPWRPLEQGTVIELEGGVVRI